MTNTAKSAAFWSKASRKYAASPIRNMDGYLRTLERTKSYLKPTDSILELGCGTGSTALLLAPQVARITASDISPGMIEIAEEKQKRERVDNITFKVSDVLEHAPEDGPYDAVLAHNLLHLLTDLEGALDHIGNLVKPGGVFISKTVCAPERGGVKFALLRRIAIPILQLVGKAPFVEFVSTDELDRKVAAAGFTIVEASDQDGMLPSHYLVARKE